VARKRTAQEGERAVTFAGALSMPRCGPESAAVVEYRLSREVVTRGYICGV
jgi:hypothetical protein